MSRKPIDQQQPHECRQAIWEWIQAQGGRQFHAKDIDVKLHVSSIREYLTALTNGGYLDLLLKGCRYEANIYRQIKDCGAEAPRLKKDGSPVTQGIGRRNMWRSMKAIHGNFTPAQLANYASTEDHRVAISEAATYCAALCAAGYLVGRANQCYQLLSSKWSGPYPPQIQRTKQVYDPNLKKVVWSKVERGAE